MRKVSPCCVNQYLLHKVGLRQPSSNVVDELVILPRGLFSASKFLQDRLRISEVLLQAFFGRRCRIGDEDFQTFGQEEGRPACADDSAAYDGYCLDLWGLLARHAWIRSLR